MTSPSLACGSLRGTLLGRPLRTPWPLPRAGGVTILLLALVMGCGAGRDEAEHAAHAAAPGAPPYEGGSAHEGGPAHEGKAALPAGMAEVEVPAERRQLLGVRTEELELRELSRSFRTVGIVVADERRVRRIQTKISGWVEELFVNFTGERVRAGQPILAVYSPELVATQREYLLALEATAQQGPGRPQRPTEQRPAQRAGGERSWGLDAGLGATPERALLLDSARARLELFDVDARQIAELERTREPRRRVVLHSPIGGTVTFKSVLQGTYVTPEMELYTVADLDPVWIWADVTEEEIPLVSLGQHARIEVAAAPGERTGIVSFLQPTLDPATRTLRVRFDVANPDGALKPGMYASVSLERPLGEVLALPEDALIDTGVRRVVFVEVAEGRFQPREVKLGRKGETHYEVLEGLAAGERVVVSAQFLLDSESRLRGVARPTHGAH